MDAVEVKQAARNQWTGILSHLGGISIDTLDGNHHPCPKCGGRDRFRMIDSADGALFCNQCFKTNNGDGFSALQWLTGCQFPESVEKVASYLGIFGTIQYRSTSSTIAPTKPLTSKLISGPDPLQPQKYEPEKPKKALALDKLEFLPWDDIRAKVWCIGRPPIEPTGMQDVGTKFGKHKYGKDSWEVYALPIYGPELDPNNPIGWAMLPTGKSLPAKGGEGKIQWVKSKLLSGSGKGVIGQVERLANANIVWKVEGLKDLLSIASLNLPHDHCAITTGSGAGEIPEGWLLQMLAGKTVYVIHDRDVPGQNGAVGYKDDRGRFHPGWCNYLAEICQVKNIDLGAPVADTHGFDLQDWLNIPEQQINPFQNLIELADSTPLTEFPTEGVGQTAEAPDDPTLLARLNLEHCRKIGRSLIFWRDKWYSYKDGVYQEVATSHIENKVAGFIERRFVEVQRIEYEQWRKKKDKRDGDIPPIKRKVTVTVVKNVLMNLRSICSVRNSQVLNQWIGKPTKDILLSCNNGILNVTKTVEKIQKREEFTAADVMVPHSPQWFSVNKVPYDYDPQAKCEYYRAWLKEVFTPEDTEQTDYDSISTLQKWFGYLLSGSSKLHKILTVIGPARSGKGTLANTMTEVFGETSIVSPSLSEISNGFALESMVGKSICVFRDARLSRHADGDAIMERLLSISGGDAVNIQRKHISTMTNQRLDIRFTLFSNLVPSLRDPSSAFISRMIFISMPNQYLGREIYDVGDRIREERSGILNWAISGLVALQDNYRIQQPESADHLANEMQSIMSPVKKFVIEMCEQGHDFETPTDEMFKAFSKWAFENDISFVGNIQSFSRKLKATCSTIDTERYRKSQTERGRKFTGIRLRVEEVVNNDKEVDF